MDEEVHQGLPVSEDEPDEQKEREEATGEPAGPGSCEAATAKDAEKDEGKAVPVVRRRVATDISKAIWAEIAEEARRRQKSHAYISRQCVYIGWRDYKVRGKYGITKKKEIIEYCNRCETVAAEMAREREERRNMRRYGRKTTKTKTPPPLLLLLDGIDGQGDI